MVGAACVSDFEIFNFRSAVVLGDRLFTKMLRSRLFDNRKDRPFGEGSQGHFEAHTEERNNTIIIVVLQQAAVYHLRDRLFTTT